MYPILNLRYHKEDLHWYFRSLEEVIIRALKSAFSINASRVEGLTGVWVGTYFKYIVPAFQFFSPSKHSNDHKFSGNIASLMHLLHFLSRGSESCSDWDSWLPDDSLSWFSTERHNGLDPI